MTRFVQVRTSLSLALTEAYPMFEPPLFGHFASHTFLIMLVYSSTMSECYSCSFAKCENGVESDSWLCELLIALGREAGHCKTRMECREPRTPRSLHVRYIGAQAQAYDDHQKNKQQKGNFSVLIMIEFSTFPTQHAHRQRGPAVQVCAADARLPRAVRQRCERPWAEAWRRPRRALGQAYPS
jgi:hypothetical protein